jgi:hypothetical protein
MISSTPKPQSPSRKAKAPDGKVLSLASLIFIYAVPVVSQEVFREECVDSDRQGALDTSMFPEGVSVALQCSDKCEVSVTIRGRVVFRRESDKACVSSWMTMDFTSGCGEVLKSSYVRVPARDGSEYVMVYWAESGRPAKRCISSGSATDVNREATDIVIDELVATILGPEYHE